MDNEIKNKLKKADSLLDQKLRDLETLEQEKIDILKRYAKATSEQRREIEQEIKLSEDKFKKLEEEVTAIYDKIKLLKNDYC